MNLNQIGGGHFSAIAASFNAENESDLHLSSCITDLLDVANGLTRAGGNHKIYLKLLSRFASAYADYAHNFKEYLATENWKEAERSAHMLRGISGSLVSGDLQIQAGKLEEACKNRQIDTATADLAALIATLTPLLNALQLHFAEA